MMMNIFKMGVVTSVAAGMVSCGGSGGQPLSGAATSNVISQIATQLALLPRSNTSPAMPAGLTGVSTSGGPTIKAITCETVSPTPLVDADADNIAKSKISTFDCTDMASGGDTVTRKGSITVTDADDTKAGMRYGMRVDFAVTKYTSTGTDGSKYDYTYDGFWNYTESSGSQISTSKFSGRHYYYSPSYAYETDFIYTYTWDWKQTPDNEASPWTTGSQTFTGTYGLTGKFHQEDHGSGVHSQGNGTFVMRYYSKDLLYDSSCSKWYKSGSIFFDDNNGSVFEIRYGCTTATFYVNGAASTLYTP